MDLLSEIPMGFGMALAQDTKAMEIFSNLSDNEKQEIIDGTHSVKSKAEMKNYVGNLKKTYY